MLVVILIFWLWSLRSHHVLFVCSTVCSDTLCWLWCDNNNNCARDNPGDSYPVDLAPFVPEELGVGKDDVQNMKRVEDYDRSRTKRVHAQLQQGKNIACAQLPAPIA